MKLASHTYAFGGRSGSRPGHWMRPFASQQSWAWTGWNWPPADPTAGRPIWMQHDGE